MRVGRVERRWWSYCCLLHGDGEGLGRGGGDDVEIDAVVVRCLFLRRVAVLLQTEALLLLEGELFAFLLQG